MAQRASGARHRRPAVAVGPTANASSSHQRLDIQGLRGIAVLAVVAYHAGCPGVGGGYIGVDAFFVVSGFLITGLILREIRTTGRLSFARFYARRARRILPAASLVLVITVLASVASLPPLLARSVLKDAMATALFAGNYRFATVGTDYLAGQSQPSPILHYWSLGVEEQFYLLWPALIVAAALLGGRWRRTEALVGAALVSITAASFLESVHLTSLNPPWAFFSLPTRAWELGTGGLVELAVPVLVRVPFALRAALGWSGLAVLGWSIVALSSTTPFPGTAALAPVLGSAAVIASGCGSSGAGPRRVLGSPLLTALGGISFSWYLWHWPVLVLVPASLGHGLTLPPRLALLVISGVLAATTTQLVENPIRSAGVLREHPRRVAVVAATLVAVSVLTPLAAQRSVGGLSGSGAVAGAVSLGPVAPSGVAAARAAGKSGGQSAAHPVAPQLAALMSQDARISAALRTAAGTRSVPSNLDPSLGDAAGDKAPPFLDGCNLSWTDVQQGTCTYARGQPGVVLFGDSHAAQWFPPLERIAQQRRWNFESLTKTTCPPIDIDLFSPYLGRPYTECLQWRAQVLARIAAERPRLVVLGVARHYNDLYHLTVYNRAWDDALRRTVADIRAMGPRVLVLGPTPKPPADVPTCLSAHLTQASACTFSAPSGVNRAGLAGERNATTASGGEYLDVARWACTTTTCPVILGNLLVYRDDNHLTTTFTSWLTPALDLAITAALARVPLPV